MKDKEKYAQFVRFCANGVLAVAIQYGVYLLLVQWINPFAANTVGYAVSFCVNFIITSYWTFRSRPSWRKLAGFGGSHIVNYVCQQAFLALFLWAGIAKEYAAIMAMGSAVPVNFMILRVIYKKKPEGRKARRNRIDQRARMARMNRMTQKLQRLRIIRNIRVLWNIRHNQHLTH